MKQNDKNGFVFFSLDLSLKVWSFNRKSSFIKLKQWMREKQQQQKLCETKGSATTQIMFHLFASSFFMIPAIKSTHTETEKPFEGNRCAVCTRIEWEQCLWQTKCTEQGQTTTTIATQEKITNGQWCKAFVRNSFVWIFLLNWKLQLKFPVNNLTIYFKG